MLESERGKQNREHDYYCPPFSAQALATSVTPVPPVSRPLCRPAGSLSAVHPPPHFIFHILQLMQDVDRGDTSRSHFNYESDEE